MRDLFFEDASDMPQGIGTSPADAAQEIRDALVGRYVCPFCGSMRELAEGPCPRCTMENTTNTRQATKARIGPWYVLQARNPAAPGMKFDTLLAFVRKGRVKPRTIVRGPTTHQLWRFAAHVKGLSREFGICHSCGGAIERTGALCPHCNRPQDPPRNPDVFIEGQEELPPGQIPIYREVGAPPLVAEDIASASLAGGAPRHDLKQPVPGQGDIANRRRKADGFLTAQDLAAAFKLKVKPKGHWRATEPHAAWQHPSPPDRPRRKGAGHSRRHWKRWTLLSLALFCICGVAYAVYRDPSLGTRASDWYGQASAWARQKWAAIQQSATAHPSPRAAPLPTTTDPPSPATGDSARDARRPAGQPASRPSPWDTIYGQGGPASAPSAPRQQPAHGNP